MRPTDATIRKSILHLLHERGEGKTICPSEVARALAGDTRAEWEPLMEPVRAVAASMASEGMLAVTQRGHVVEAASAKGPIRLRLR